MYQVLARKWRPKNFHELVGQTHVTQALTYALDHNRIHHAYLFTGTRGVGKTTIARIFAKSLNCQKNHVSSNPCGECDHCKEIDQGRFPDLIEVDAASRSRVEETRELLDNVPYAPVKGQYKVYLIDEVHMFSASSFNALLKTLEEPPPHVKFILATTDPQKLPATILSRCLQFHLKNMSERQISEHLAHILQAEHAEYEPDALHLLANAAAGSMRDSLSLLDQALAYGRGHVRTRDVATLLGAVPEPQLLHMLQLLANGDAPGLRNTLESLDEYAPDYAGLLLRLLQQMQKITIAQLGAERYAEEIPAALHALAARLPVELLQLWYQIGNEAWQNLPYQPDARMALEMSLLRMIALQPLLPTSDPAQARPVREAAPASDSLTASLQAQTTPATATPAATTEPQAVAPSETASHGEAPAAPTTATVHAEPADNEPPPWEDTTPAAADDSNDAVPPWVSETIPDDSERTPAKKPESAPAAAIAPETAAPAAAKKPAAPPANTTDPGDLIDNLERWSDFLASLDLHEYPLLLLENSVPASWQAPLLSLYTAPTGIIFDQAQNREQAAAAIAHALGIACTIEIQPADALKTPIEYRRQKNAAAQQRAEQDFLNHPQIRAAQATFGPALQVDNIQPLNPQE
ncbi:DNA polymerase III subunit tau [Cardiobacterium hominis]|uniref:DNA polymerase III subunit gamma/tau n=1 Tax=Cardiobacterium hominis (strain ATCC 15826 / DSM 8339 / NCTC 10426 / 6573) TaxID=638300 RepID=C8NBE6_CARH6|nr:DNA polymerase III subunit gamma/tau [Cardiobacterium hominis]EEV88114.1 DNA polymerase III, subunit gamma and tau [Cardiobacterium hominis ATCC 15826]VEG77859.1 DNA polymerase III subunit tau [Cardiobacterium hominis]